MSHKEFEPQPTGGFYEEFINSPVIDHVLVDYLLAESSFLQEAEDKRISEVLKTIGEANRIIPSLIKNLMDPILKTSTEEYGNADNLFRATQYFLEPENAERVAERIFSSSSLAVMVATAHFGVKEMAKIHESEESEDEKQKALVYTRYFGAAQVILLGYKTNTTAIALNPEIAEKPESKEIAPLVKFDDEDEMKHQRLRLIFEGFRVSEVNELDSGARYLSILRGDVD